MSNTGEVRTLIRRHDLVLGAIHLRPVAGSSFTEIQLAGVTQVADALASLI
jgi:hypothetical protein